MGTANSANILFLVPVWLSLLWHPVTPFISDGAAAKKFGAQQTSFCNDGSTAILSERVVVTVSNVSSKVECLIVCFLAGGGEVCQFYNTNNSSVKLCGCTLVPARYLLAFPQRYLQCINNSQSTGSSNNNSIHWIFYRSDRLWSNWSSPPLLFYALDDVSGTINLGSLGGVGNRYSAQWMNGSSGHIDCPWSGDDSSSSRPKLLRFVPSESPWLAVVHNLTLSLSPGYTWMVWFKKRDPTTTLEPILDAMLGAAGGPSAYKWFIWNNPSASTLMFYFASGTIIYLDGAFTPTSWNNVVMRIGGSNMSSLVNGTLTRSDTFDVGGAVLGDRIYVGRRVMPGNSLDGSVWNGCLGHVMLFNDSLSEEEVNMWASLVGDDDF
jgi:hypothetical protein